MDSDGHRNTSDSETTPLAAASKRKLAVMDPEWVALTANASWSIDAVDILRAYASSYVSTMVFVRLHQ